jgi:hypothetical protein
VLFLERDDLAVEEKSGLMAESEKEVGRVFFLLGERELSE